MKQIIRRHQTSNKIPSRFYLILCFALLPFLLFAAAHALGTNSLDATVLLPRDASRTVDLSTFRGQTYLQAMQASENGIFAKADADDAATVTVASADQIAQNVTQFDSKVSQQIFGMFKNGQADFHALVANIEGKSFSPQTIRSGLQPYISQANLAPHASPNIAVDASADMVLLGSGSGTLVQIDPANYFYNLGYQKPNVKSGRSYGAGPGRSLLDPSDKEYLTEMAAYFQPSTTPDASAFYTAILKVLTNCDSSDFAALPSAGQVTATDFMTIYTAELDRHVMVNLVPATHPWEIDLAEVTFLNSYGAPSGMVMKAGALVPGTAVAYFAVGTKGSGIGETRRDFVKLATRITSFENESNHHPDLVKAIVDLTPITDRRILEKVRGDVLRRYLVYLNRPEFQSNVQAHASELVNAMVAFLKQINADNAEITQYIQSNPQNHRPSHRRP
ncbi:MAG TPA: hypothetical protein VE077_08205 [Candidatus Methylomirabilis sp.]|nr:hypothetical protein [Candidatus Methylomirabilis sp.]